MAKTGMNAYPNLLRPALWGSIHVQFFINSTPPTEAIANVNIIPFVGDEVVVIRTASGNYEIPGGTLEPGETYIDTIRRELIEEAGGNLLNFTPLGFWRCHSTLTEPYRPHLPHPDFVRIAGYGDVELTGAPTNPAGGEKITAVEMLAPSDAAERFASNGRADLADLYLLAASFKLNAK